MIIGIDSSNLHQGGGVTHLVEILSCASLHKHNISKVIVWGSEQTLDRIDERPWLIKITPKELNRSIFYRLLWQKFKLSRSAIANNCDLIFSPGGSISCSFRPIVTMSRNMLPFEWNEARRYGVSWITVRLILLRWLQSKSFSSASGVIFLTNYAKKQVIKVTGSLPSLTTIIPHGFNSRFCTYPKEQCNISEYSLEKPFQILYVSIVDQYKHQWRVVEAVARLRKEGSPVVLNLVGPSYPPALNRLTKVMNKFDVNNEWVKYHGEIPYLELHNIYKGAQLGVFASSCENMPNILLETMASGLPIACSDKGPMPEILGNSGLYFDPEQPIEIYQAIKNLIDDPQLRSKNANASFLRAQKYSWDVCAFETFSFLEQVVSNHQQSLCAE
ncbi:glycosyltransferase family 4 protein [Candidatus Woesearchaeota archaeon]|jgi:glycosyltransferase involved in cell wall biosynthesis|nr:glycosyltransferase family 4 protein [Candidatus Woesearchaeota archaeon]